MKKQHLFYFGFVLMSIIGLQSCGNANNAIDEKPDEVPTTATKIAFRSIANGYLTGNGAEGIKEGGIVINSPSEFDDLVQKMNSVNEGFQKPEVDFKKMTVLAYFDKIRGSGGYSVSFTSVTKIEKSIQSVIKQTDAVGDAIEIMTQPYTLVIIDKSDGKVVFIEQ